jgi:MATE family multidrug resistance protein
VTVDAGAHPFVRRPHRTLFALSLPVLLSLLAEPLTGLADTFFLARLGTAPLAALGVGTALLSGVFWVFNFLGIGTQTEVAGALGSDNPARAADAAELSIRVSLGLGVVLALAVVPGVEPAVLWMGATGDASLDASLYLWIRLVGAPAVLGMMAAFGALRGLQDMRTPLWIAVLANLLNVVADPLLIFGAGPIPAMGVAGAAGASVAAQWLAALLAIAAVRRRLGRGRPPGLRAVARLFVVGRDLVVRTGLLLLFQVLATRVANRAGVESGAAHQAVRQFWMLTAFVLDAWAAAAQSLVGYFLGAGQWAQARRVAGIAAVWSIATGVALAVGMIAASSFVGAQFVPESARQVFAPAWLACALAQPLNALAFVTDGIHWGAGDYTYLRNAMIAASGVGALGLLAVDPAAPDALAWVWWVTAAWIAARAALGVLRVWPGSRAAPLAQTSSR